MHRRGRGGEKKGWGEQAGGKKKQRGRLFLLIKKKRKKRMGEGGTNANSSFLKEQKLQAGKGKRANKIAQLRESI